jgi:hypothetical protein
MQSTHYFAHCVMVVVHIEGKVLEQQGCAYKYYGYQYNLIAIANK